MRQGKLLGRAFLAYGRQHALIFCAIGGMIARMRKGLRIIQVVNVRWFNATAWYGLSLSRLLAQAGHEVLVLGLPGTESFARAEAMGLAPRALPLNTAHPLVLPSLLRDMNALVRDLRPHIVNCHRGEGLVLWGLLKAAGRSFALVRTRGDQRPPKGNIANRMLHARLVDALVATNSRTALQCRRLFGLDGETLFTIPGGVDAGRFAPDPAGREAVRREHGFAPDDLVVGLLGRFDPVKGHRELMEALAAVRRGKGGGAPQAWRSRLRLMLVGLPASFSAAELRQWSRALGLEPCTIVAGAIDALPAHISAMDLGVVASQGSEAIARAAFEIMACGVPLVGTNVGVMPDLLSENALAPAGDAPALQALLERALGDSDFRGGLRREQAEAMGEHTEPRFLEKTMQAYEAAMARARA